MPRFFVNQENITQNIVTINNSDAKHIGRSLRMKIGENITVCCKGIEYECKLKDISDELVVCDIISQKPCENEPNVNVTLFQAMPKSDKFDFIVQKAVELGVHKICPVITSRCISRPDKKSFAKKQERFQKISLEAAKQSGRGIIPEILDIITFEECINQMKNFDNALMCYEKGGINLRNANLSENTNIAVLIGSEGGFSPEESQKALDNNVTLIGLGSRILRCETAPIAALSIIMNLTQNM